MSGRIYLVDENQGLISMAEQAYDSEDLLQFLLANYPDLLASDQIGNEPRRWLLISREVAVPDREVDSFRRWSLDHLFLDQDGIPTLVEVKRSSDMRIRREVVGQMLDYAANAVAYWKLDEIRARFEAQCEDIDPGDVLEEALGITSASVFWQMVETNLRAGKIRLVFVADEIPKELRRIVEFLNEQMNPTEVLAIAIRQYVGQGLQTLVPTLYGHTAKAQGAKSKGDGQRWSEDTFFPELTTRQSQTEANIARKILEWAHSRGLRIWWGEGKRSGSFIPILDIDEQSHYPVAIWTNGGIEIQFQHMQNRPPFDNLELRREFLDRLNRIHGISLPDDSLGRRPSFPIKVLTKDDHLDLFIAALDWFIEMTHRSTTGFDS
ncbi:MAG: hypothetical protein JW966_02620 [Anaerolineae bacterium]|nr:hypothetical protein [Anaerolineae bacterium]